MVEKFLNENSELNLDELMEMARKIAEQANPELEILRELEEARKKADKEVNEDKMANFTKIVKGVAKKYSVENFGIERDDLKQELWVKVLELIEANGGIEKVNERMVAKACWNKAVDYYRYSRRRRDSKAAYNEEFDEDAEDSKSSDGKIHCAKFENCFDSILIREVIDLFPKGSRERKYVVTKLYMYGEIDKSTYDGEDELVLPENDTEEAILKIMGYNSKYPASWGAKKGEMKETIYRYLGKYDEIDMIKDSITPEQRHKLVRSRVENLFKETKSYWMYSNKLIKDTVLRTLKVSEEDLVESIIKSKRLLVVIDHTNGKSYIMKNEEKWVKHVTNLGDTILTRD